MVFKSISFLNYSGCIADIQCDVRNGFPGFDVAVNTSYSHSRDISQHLRSSIHSQGLKIPNGSITVECRCERPRVNFEDFELAIVLGVLMHKISTQQTILVIGSVDLHGNIRQKPYDINSIIRIAKENKIEDILVPFGAFSIQDVLPKGVNIVFVKDIRGALESCARIANRKEKAQNTNKQTSDEDNKKQFELFEGVIGLDDAKFALIVALAGGHNALLVGPRGSGKSLLLSRAASAIPDSFDFLKKQREYNKHLLINSSQQVDLKSPNYLSIDSQSAQKYLTPAPLMPLIAYHSCYICIDELADVQYRHLQVLKDICDKGYVNTKDDKYPLNISILAAINPCPCGNSGLKNTPCFCSKGDIEKHTRSLRQSLFSRFELKIPIAPASLASQKEKDYSNYIDKIKKARAIQNERYNGKMLNSFLSRTGLDSAALTKACELFPFSDNIRDTIMLFSIARTLADLSDRSGLDGSSTSNIASGITSSDASLARMLFTLELI